MNRDNGMKEEILSRIDLVDLINQEVRLVRRGANFKGLCPFHTEKTPSFTVSPDKQIYKCFGCGKSGNAITFAMDFYGFNFIESMKFLADKAGLQFEFEKKDPEQEDRKTLLYSGLDYATQFFQDALHSKQGKFCLDYYNKRGFAKATLDKFRLGYAPDSFTELSKHLKSLGFDEDIIADAGLTVQSEQGKVYDRFRNRAIFPIFDIFGRTIAYGARILVDDKSQAKYINSPQTELYDKSRVLYGLNFAKNEIISHKKAILTEGYIDVISMHQNGFGNAIASSGTSLTNQQLQALKRYSEYITILYDGDNAGIEAAERAIKLALENDFEPSIVILPNQEDPDSFIKNNGVVELRKYLQNEEKNFLDFLINKEITQKQTTSKSKTEAIINILEIVDLVKNDIQKQLLVQELGSKLNFDSIQTKNLLSKLKNIKKFITKNPLSQKGENSDNITSSNIEKECKILIKRMRIVERSFLEFTLKNESNFQLVISDDEVEYYLITEISKKLFNFIKENESLAKVLIAINDDNVNPYQKSIINQLAIENEKPSENWNRFSQIDEEANPKEMFELIKTKLELDYTDNKIKSLTELLSGNLQEAELHSTLELINSLNQQKQKLIQSFNKN